MVTERGHRRDGEMQKQAVKSKGDKRMGKKTRKVHAQAPPSPNLELVFPRMYP